MVLSNTTALASSANIIVYGPSNQLNNAGGVFDASGTLYPAVWTLGASQTLSGDGQVQGNVALTGTSNVLYNVYGADSLTPPVVWDVIGTTTASGLGVLDFTDTQATNAEGYYRFGY
jgi:hypothetical protein